MYLIKNAFANIVRNKGRNILMGCILFMILFASAVSVSTHKSSQKMIDSYRSQFSSDIVITRNDEKLPKNLNEYREPELRDYEKFAQSDLLKSTTYMASTAAVLENGKAVDEANGTMGNVIRDEGADPSQTYKVSTNMMYGVNEDAMDTLFDDTRKLAEGKKPSAINEAVISKELADANGWKIGDEFQISTTDLETMKKVKLSLTITGLYEDSSPAYTDREAAGMALLNRRNEILTTMQTITQVTNDSSVTVSFTIQDPSQVDALAKEFYAKGLPEYFDVTADDSQYKNVLMPVEGLMDITKIFTLAIVMCGIVILLILSILSIRERKYEIGVLRAMGMKKGKIAMGMFTEIFIIAGMCLILALPAAVISGEPIANAVYQTQQTEHSQDASNMQPIETIEVTLDRDTILLIILISLALTGSASLISMVYVTKYEPLKILSGRN